MRHARIQQAKPERSFAERIVAVIVAIAMLGGMGYATTSAAMADDAGQTLEQQAGISMGLHDYNRNTINDGRTVGETSHGTTVDSNVEPASNTTIAKTAGGDSEDLGAPTHRKYIRDNGDGTYWLSLDVTGASRASTEKKHQPADVVLVMDSSGSMAGQRWNTATAAATALAQKLLTSENVALPVDEQVQMSVVDFDTTARNMELDGTYWTTDSDEVSTSFSQMDASSGNGGGTNWEAALKSANGLSSNRAGVAKYIVFVSDGTPSFRNSSMGTYCRRYDRNPECAYYQKNNVYGTGQGVGIPVTGISMPR